MKNIRLVIISGPSGSGKSTAIRVLEDLGFFCVDNLPVILLPKVMDLAGQSQGITKIATVVDVREGEFLKDFPSVMQQMRDSGHNVELIYLETSEEILQRRFSETRRRHPLAADDTFIESIRQERDLLADVRMMAGKIIDTSEYNVHQLKDIIRDYFLGPSQKNRMVIRLVSFAYRYGIPTDADIIMDVRFLPNPYFVDDLKNLDGRDDKVRDFVFQKDETKEFISRFNNLIEYLVPQYIKEGKSFLTIAIGCTGGRHRSVAIVDFLAGKINNVSCNVKVRHRDIDRQ